MRVLQSKDFWLRFLRIIIWSVIQLNIDIDIEIVKISGYDVCKSDLPISSMWLKYSTPKEQNESKSQTKMNKIQFTTLRGELQMAIYPQDESD